MKLALCDNTPFSYIYLFIWKVGGEREKKREGKRKREKKRKRKKHLPYAGALLKWP